MFSIQPDWHLCEPPCTVWLNERSSASSSRLHTHRIALPSAGNACSVTVDAPAAPLSVQLNREARQLRVLRNNDSGDDDASVAATFQHARRVEPFLGPLSCVGVSAATVALGTESGDVVLCDALTGGVRRRLDAPAAHVGDVTRAIFFPSGVVLLTAGIDGRCQIIDATDGELVATLRGQHSGAMLGAAMIDRGRTLFTSGRDGTVRLWDVSTQSVLRLFRADAAPRALHDCCLAEQHVAVAVSDAGQLVAFDTRSDAAAPAVAADVATSPLRACLCLDDATTIWCGDESGVVTALDVRRPDAPLHRLHRDLFVGEVRSLAAANGALFVGTSAGLLLEYNAVTAAPGRSFTGANADPVHAAASGQLLVSATRDGELRMFDI